MRKNILCVVIALFLLSSVPCFATTVSDGIRLSFDPKIGEVIKLQIKVKEIMVLRSEFKGKKISPLDTEPPILTTLDVTLKPVKKLASGNIQMEIFIDQIIMSDAEGKHQNIFSPSKTDHKPHIIEFSPTGEVVTAELARTRAPNVMSIVDEWKNLGIKVPNKLSKKGEQWEGVISAEPMLEIYRPLKVISTLKDFKPNEYAEIELSTEILTKDVPRLSDGQPVKLSESGTGKGSITWDMKNNFPKTAYIKFTKAVDASSVLENMKSSPDSPLKGRNLSPDDSIIDMRVEITLIIMER